MDPYQRLIDAIILRAVTDCRMGFLALKKNPIDSHARGSASEILEFFNSEWFAALTDLNPDNIIKRLTAEVQA